MSRDAFWFLLGTMDASPVPAEADPSRVDPRTVAGAALLAERNGLYYPFMETWLRRGGTVPRGQEARWAAELQDRAHFRNTIETLNRVVEDSGVEYAVIKNSWIQDPVPRDVDILVRDDDRDAFLAGLDRAGFVTASKDEAEYSLIGPERLRVDVYSRIHYLGRDFIPAGDLFASTRIQRTHGIDHPALSPESAFLVNSVHGLLGHGALSLLDLLDLIALQRTIGDLARVRARANSAGWGTMFDRWVAHIEQLRAQVFDERRVVRFPARHGRRFILDSVGSLEGRSFTHRDLRVLSLTLLWDDLLYYSEDVGLERVLKRSRIAATVANFAGHNLRILRGDRKSARPLSGRDSLGRARTWFR